MKMERKDEWVGLRLDGIDHAKLAQIAALRQCTLSEALRLMIRGTQVKTVAVIEITPPAQNELVVA
jgi:hypothetical protein